MEAIHRLYIAMAREMDPETGLGGKLLYAGDVDAAGKQDAAWAGGASGCHLLRAANIAGAASLAASADAAELRRTMREGAIDFVVNSLDEALRILKNQIRKKQTVSVGLALAPEAVLRDMAARGVQPDLLAPRLPEYKEIEIFIAHGARRIEPEPLPPENPIRLVAIPADWKQPASAFDAQLLDCLAPGDFLNRRWVRFSPRYLPAAARRLRLMAGNADKENQRTTAGEQ